MKSLFAAVVTAGLSILATGGAARADCPGGENPPYCETGAVHRLGANQRCWKFELLPSHHKFALVYGQNVDPQVTEGLEKYLQEGASLSVLTNGAISAAIVCGDSTFTILDKGVRVPGY